MYPAQVAKNPAEGPCSVLGQASQPRGTHLPLDVGSLGKQQPLIPRWCED